MIIEKLNIFDYVCDCRTFVMVDRMMCPGFGSIIVFEALGLRLTRRPTEVCVKVKFFGVWVLRYTV